MGVKTSMLMTGTNSNILRNALIEGGWAFTTFFVGSGFAGFTADKPAWIYGALASFLTGFVGYLTKAYGVAKKNSKETKK